MTITVSWRGNEETEENMSDAVPDRKVMSGTWVGDVDEEEDDDDEEISLLYDGMARKALFNLTLFCAERILSVDNSIPEIVLK